MTRFSIVIPTLNEAANIDPLLARLFALALPAGSFEVIVVDDGSRDGTADKVRAWQGRAPVRLLVRREQPDLAASILAGVEIADSDVILVMDADLSHPPESVVAVVAPVLDGSHDIAVGSRCVPGGGSDDWPRHRRLLSQVGSWLAWSLCDVRDATSGFFAFRRPLAARVSPQARGYKILLELLAAWQGELRVVEVPIRFRDRTHGSSKLTLAHQWIYLQRLLALAGGTVSTGTAGRFAAVGVVGLIVDLALFQGLIGGGAGLAPAHIAGFFAATLTNYTLNKWWAFRHGRKDDAPPPRYDRFLTICLLALLMRGGILALLVYSWGMPAAQAIFPAIAATAIVNYLGAAFYVFPSRRPPPDLRWRVVAVGVVGFVIALRLVYLGQLELIPDEAYYWAYAQHMALSFLDHPPLVAWLIWLGTAVAGDSELGVRSGAFICGLLAMGYLYAFARNLHGKTVAMRAVMLLAILPFGFASGLLMTPDAPLMAAWAATLYYLERALVAGRRGAWLGVGIAGGLGLLAKYTLALLGPAALLYMLLDPAARRWLRRPQPYLAAGLALLLFAPVLIWNAEHQWASFLFQTVRRMAADDRFSTPWLLAHAAALLTPTGLLAAALALRSGSPSAGAADSARRRLFVRVFTGVPLAVFVTFSLLQYPRFHWTSPVWLALLPGIASMMGDDSDRRWSVRQLRRAWQPTVIVTVLAYAALLHYLVLGLPGVPYPRAAQHYFWRETAAQVDQVAAELRRQTGQQPVVVGMSKWSIASALAFYDSAGDAQVRSRNLFNDSAAMYEFWFPSLAPIARPILLVGMDRKTLERNRDGDDLGLYLQHPGPIEARPIRRDGKLLRHLYYRVAAGYRGYPPAPAQGPIARAEPAAGSANTLLSHPAFTMAPPLPH